jgi:hypothetical protein
VVISIGTLYGVDTDGEESDGVRYVDIYEVRSGEIERLDIYNDLAVNGISLSHDRRDYANGQRRTHRRAVLASR